MKHNEAAEQFLAKALGDEGLEELRKFELYKLQTNTVLDHEEIRTALQIVPRTVLSLLQRELTPMGKDQGKEIRLPVREEAYLHVTKMSNDVYTGEIREKSKIVAKFRDRSLPGVGLVVMSTFELYDVNQLASEKSPEVNDDTVKIQRIIDERLGLRDLVRQVVDQRLSEREAVDHLIRIRLMQVISEAKKDKVAEQISNVTKIATSEPEAQKDPYFRGMANGLQVADSIANDKEPEFIEAPKKKLLKDFLDKKTKKRQPEFQIEISKSEVVTCPDCGKDIFSNGSYTGCICFGDDRDNKIYIKKTENGVSMRFPKSWDADNIQMLLETLRSKNRSDK